MGTQLVRHGVRIGGGTFPGCPCTKQPCGGVRSQDMRDDCPEHNPRANPALSWHRAEHCHPDHA